MTKRKIGGLVITSLPGVAIAAGLVASTPSVAQNFVTPPAQGEQAASVTGGKLAVGDHLLDVLREL